MASTLPAKADKQAVPAAEQAEPTDVPAVSIDRDEIDHDELEEWFESLDDVLHRYGPEKVTELLELLEERAYRRGIRIPFTANTPYINTIPHDEQPEYPGDKEIERRIRSIIRWNAMAMVVRANRTSNVGGHISTFASAATLVEVGQSHFFRARTNDHPGDMVYFQGHASPGIYARAFVEGRLDEAHLIKFRREIPRGTGLSSYPHPWLMPEFWQFPTVSMGLGPLCSIYHARFLRYLEHRGLIDTSQSRVWCFVGDGEVDEPETLGALTLASREGLDNLTWVINCNLQRLDGPVRGNGKIIQELEAIFRGAGWNCLKVIWGSEWDPLLDADDHGELVKRMEEVVDGQYQKFSVESGAYIRENFFNTPELQAMVENLTDDQLRKMRRGGHDPEKVYAAYKAAVEHKGQPTVILAKTIKGYGLGEEAEGKNTTHQQKKLNEDSLRQFRDRFEIPISDEELKEEAPFYRPPEDSPEMKYLQARRKELGGYVPARIPTAERLEVPTLEEFKKTQRVITGREVSTTIALGEIIRWLMSNKHIGKRIVPIIPDEAQTFGMHTLFAQVGIYSSKGQLYEPVDLGQMVYYREAKDGQILEEGINEAGSTASFVAAGTAYANVGLTMVPFYVYYSMFGFQRVGDLIWLAADSRCRGFLCGGTAGRTTLNGEGLQHEDGHTQLYAGTVPNLKSYDPAYGYEVMTIVQDGMRRMYQDGEDIFYYLTVYNENYEMPDMPAGVTEGVLKGIYPLERVDSAKKKGYRPQLFGSGTILREVRRAQQILADQYGIESDVWSVTSYNELRRDCQAVERLNALHPGRKPQTSFLQDALAGLKGPFIASSDYVKTWADQIRPWIPGRYVVLGTDGFGRSDTRQALRRHFEVDAECVAYATLHALAQDGQFDAKKLPKVLKDLDLDPEKIDPAIA